MTSTPTLLDTTDARPVHFIGIAGAGMSALAELLARRGIAVQGTDANATGAPDLVRLGVHVSAHDAALVDVARAVVFSSAIPSSHPEIARARELGLPVIRRAEALAEAVSGGTLVAVAGTHGKTTTTVMTTGALERAGRNPTGIVGGRVGRWQGNLRLGGSELFVVEADEYDRSFLALTPTVAVVLNLEADHLDIYRDVADIQRAFEAFVAPARTIVRCADDAGAMSVRVNAAHEIISYSATAPGASASVNADSARLIATDVEFETGTGAGGSKFNVHFDNELLGEVVLFVPGIHNVRNALAAIGSGLALGCEFELLQEGLLAFVGVERRFQRMDSGNLLDVRVIDDYAHHPTEVAATIAAARASFPDRRLVVAFQPHLYSRTRDLHKDFAEALAGSDVVMLADIYGAREQPVEGVTSALIGNLIPAKKLKWSGPRADIGTVYTSRICEAGDVVITMGAGDITRSSAELVGILQAMTRT